MNITEIGKQVTIDGQEVREENVPVTLTMRATNESVLTMRHADSTATFEHEGLHGEVSWPIGGTYIYVTLNKPGKPWATYTLSLQDIAQAALKLHQERYPESPPAVEGPTEESQ